MTLPFIDAIQRTGTILRAFVPSWRERKCPSWPDPRHQ